MKVSPAEYAPTDQPSTRKFKWYARSYATRTSSSRFGGHETWEAARDDANSVVGRRGIRSVWITGETDGHHEILWMWLGCGLIQSDWSIDELEVVCEFCGFRVNSHPTEQIAA